jgi:hypothetical protein
MVVPRRAARPSITGEVVAHSLEPGAFRLVIDDVGLE